MIFFKSKKSGFTIIEILIVITVIGILVGIVAVAYPGYQERARDTKRKSDLHTLATAYKTALADGKNRSDLNYTTLGGEGRWFIPNYGVTPTLAGTPSAPTGVLNSLGYIKEMIIDPKWPEVYSAGADYIKYKGYLLFECWNSEKGIYAVGRLEQPSAADIENFESLEEQVDDIPLTGDNNEIDQNSCFYSPPGDNEAEESARNSSNTRVNKGYHMKRTLSDPDNGYNYALNIK